jgi:excisionase family DNA binding protein
MPATARAEAAWGGSDRPNQEALDAFHSPRVRDSAGLTRGPTLPVIDRDTSGPSQRPNQGLSAAEAARILGVRASTVHQWVAKGVLPKSVKWQRYGLNRTDVENLAPQRYTPGHPWFATNREAAQMLGVSRERVKQLVDAGRLPCVEYRGHRYFRRQQIQVVANARNARWHQTGNPLTR